METIDNTPDPPSVSQPAVVRPAPINVKVRFPQGSIAIRPNLWHNWTRIALRAETRAVAAHERGLMTGDTARALEDETLESMVAVSAARHAFHHLYLEWWQLLALKPENDESKVPELATTDVSTDPAKRKHWLGDLQDIVDDRMCAGTRRMAGYQTAPWSHRWSLSGRVNPKICSATTETVQSTHSSCDQPRLFTRV
jgi:hypothetical protein